MSNLLSSNQINQYNQERYLLVSRLIPDSVSIKAEQAMWHCLGGKVEEPKTWKEGTIVENYFNDDIIVCYTDEFIIAAASTGRR